MVRGWQKACVPGGGTMGRGERRVLTWILRRTLGYHFKEVRAGGERKRDRERFATSLPKPVVPFEQGNK